MRTQIEAATVPFAPQVWRPLAATYSLFLDRLADRFRRPAPEVLARLLRESQARPMACADPEAPTAASLPRSSLGPLPQTEASTLVHFSLPMELPRFWLAAAELFPHFATGRRRELAVLDLAGGPGTASSGVVLALSVLGFEGRVSCTLVEPDGRVGRLSQGTFEALGDVVQLGLLRKLQTSTVQDYLDRADERFDLVVASNVVGRDAGTALSAEETAALIQRLLRERVKRTGFLLVAAPAQKRVAIPLAAAVSKAAQALVPPFSPCLAVPCPHLSAKPEKERFCLHSVPVPLTPYHQSVCARAGLERHEAHFSYVIFAPAGRPPVVAGPAPGAEDARIGRIVSFPKRMKKGFQYVVCTREGLVTAFAPRLLPGGIKGGHLPHGTMVELR